MKQITIQEWKPELCPGTPEYIKANEPPKPEKKKRGRKKGSVNHLKKNVEDVEEINLKPLHKLTDEQAISIREYWYALLVAIMRDDINSADDALTEMGIKRQYNSAGRQSQ